MEISVLVAEDHRLVAMLIEKLLSDYAILHIIGTVSNGRDVLENLNTKAIDVILMDIDMPVLDGIETTKIVRKRYPDVKVIMLSSHIEAHLIQKALNAGANGYISKFAESSEVIEAIRQVHSGNTYYCSTTLQSVMEDFSHSESDNKFSRNDFNISKQEKVVLNLIHNGLNTREIAEKLFLSIRTVEAHRRNIMRKLNVKNVAALIKTSIERNVLDIERD